MADPLGTIGIAPRVTIKRYGHCARTAARTLWSGCSLSPRRRLRRIAREIAAAKAQAANLRLGEGDAEG